MRGQVHGTLGLGQMGGARAHEFLDSCFKEEGQVHGILGVGFREGAEPRLC